LVFGFNYVELLITAISACSCLLDKPVGNQESDCAIPESGDRHHGLAFGDTFRKGYMFLKLTWYTPAKFSF